MHWATLERSRPTFTPRTREAILHHAIPKVASHANTYDPPKQKGHCWHCNKQLTLQDTQVDHHPQPFRHIRHLWFDPIKYVPDCLQHRQVMTNDPEDYANLVPSCKECNISHKYEQNFNNCVQRNCTLALRFRLIVLFIIVFSVGCGIFVGVMINHKGTA